MYAVLDVETTGLNPTRSHRVCEIAVIHVDRHGRIEREWCSLVEPKAERDHAVPPTGPQSTADDAAGRAPCFDRLAGKVAKLLVGRLIVAHNPVFDILVLRHEFNLLGIDVPLRPELGLSTIALAAQYIPLTGRPLHHSYAASGVNVDGVKPDGDKTDCGDLALTDARAAAGLLTAYLSISTGPPPWAMLLDEAARLRWPPLPVDSTVQP
jgi:DNA polymerase-3 subunit epsilon